jgi:MFS family permease
MVVIGSAVFAVTALAWFRVPLLPSIGDDLSMSTPQLGLLTATYAVGRLATDVPAGVFADRLPAATLMRAAALSVGVGSALLAAAPAAAAAFVAVFVLGTSTALANTTGATYFSGSAPIARRGLSVSGFAGAQLAGQAFGPAIAGALAVTGSWRMPEAVAAIAAAVLFAALTFDGSRATAGAHHSPPVPVDGPVATIPARVRLALYSVPFVMFLTIGAMILTLVPVIGDEELGLSATVIGLASGLGGACRLIGAVVAGQVADRVARKAALVPGLAIQTAGVALLALSDAGTAVWLAAIVLVSIGSVGTMVAIACLADLAPAGTLGRLLGRFRFSGDLGFIVGPAVTALLFDHFGTAGAVLPVAAIGVVATVAVALLVPETRWSHDPLTAPA